MTQNTGGMQDETNTDNPLDLSDEKILVNETDKINLSFEDADLSINDETKKDYINDLNPDKDIHGRVVKPKKYFDMNEFSTKKAYTFVFILSFILAIGFFLPYIIQDKGYFFYLGDFNCQQIPFNMMANDAVKSGNIFWNWTTDLGANFIGSYAFYMIGSPFFWLMLALPSAVVPMAIPWVLCLKFAVSGLTAYGFLVRIAKNKNYALFGALMYAFSSFSMYNIFFNHFNDAIALFPLLLIGLEEYLENDKKGIFALTVFINALCNYYFFVAEVVFLIIYFYVRLYNGSWPKFNLKKLAGLAFESITGFAMAAFVVLPAVLTTIQLPRAGAKLSGWALITYYEIQRPFQILQAFFFPPDIPSQLTLFPDAGAKWSSVTAWLPLFGMIGVFALLKLPKKSWVGKMVITLSIMAFIPPLNAAFQLFSSSFYTRWFYMLVMMMSLATVIALEECTEIEFKSGILWTGIITSAMALPLNLIINPDTKKPLAAIPDRLWAYYGIAMLSLALVFYLIFILKRESKSFSLVTLILLCIVIVGYGNFNIILGRFSGIGDATKYAERNIKGREKFTLPNLDNVRIDVLEGEENSGIFWQIPTIQAFHSVVPGSIMEFYPLIGVERNVASRPKLEHIALRSFASVKYLFDGKNGDSVDAVGFKKIGTQNGFGIWENTNYLPFGFTYDKYIPRKEWEELSTDTRERTLLKAIVLDKDQEKKYAKLFEKYDSSIYVDASEEGLASDCNERRLISINSFKRDNLGFDSKITTEKETLVFYSVPNEPGWTATVNGKKAEIIKANVGFMAVAVKPGDSVIRFNYMTPGLIPGIFVFIIALILLIIYVYFLPKLFLRKEFIEYKNRIRRPKIPK